MFNIHLKFDNNRSGSIEDYSSNKSRHRRQREVGRRQTAKQKRRPIFYALVTIKRRENMKVPDLTCQTNQDSLRHERQGTISWKTDRSLSLLL